MSTNPRPITYQQFQSNSRNLIDLYNKGEVVFESSDLVYAADSRCSCGAGLAHVKDAPQDMRFWDCSAILTGTAVPKGQDGAVQHTGQFPFMFYEIKSERQPSAGGRTTRPNATITEYSVITNDECLRLTDPQKASQLALSLAEANGGEVRLSVSKRVINVEGDGTQAPSPSTLDSQRN